MKKPLLFIVLFINSLFSVAQESIVFKNDEEGYACFRIPAIIKAPNGDLLAFCEARRQSCSDHGDVRIVLKRSSDNGSTWRTLETIVENGSFQAGNPAPVVDMMDKKYPQGRVFLFYNTGTNASEQDVREGRAIREVWYKTSIDNGQTWSKPVNITPSVSRPNKPSVNPQYRFKEDWRSYANTPGHALQLTKGKYRGRIFVPANHSAGAPQADFKDYQAHGFYSDNHGKTWQLSPSVNFLSSNESTAAELSNGGIVMNIRNQSGNGKFRVLAFSKNAGAQWDSIYLEKQLPDPVCEGSMLNFKTPQGKETILFSNLDHASKRENLTLKISYDEAKTWSLIDTICVGSAAYSDLVIQKDNRIGILYEKENYSKIVYISLNFKLDK